MPSARSTLFPIATAALAVASWRPAAAQGWDPEIDGGEVFVIQERPVSLEHEFSFGLGVLPLDAFYTGYTLSASYTYHPSEVVAWEVASAFLSEDVDSGLQDELLERYEVQPTRFEKVQAGAFTHLVFKPLYGKRSLLDGPIWPAETSFLLGVGAVRYSQSVRAALDVGVVFRLHLDDWFSVRLEIRDLLPVDVGGGVDNVIHVDLAAAFNFGAEG